MRKFLTVLLLLGIAGGLSALDLPGLNISGEFSALWIPFQHLDRQNSTSTVMGSGLGNISPDKFGPQTLVIFGADGKNLGFRSDFIFRTNTQDATFGIGDNLYGWWQPLDVFRLEVGRFKNGALSGNIGDFWMAYFTTPMYDGNEIFRDFSTPNGAAGILGELSIGGLFVGVLVPNLYPLTGGDTIETVYQQNNSRPFVILEGTGEIGRVYEQIQVGIGYTIEGIGLARVQYVGANIRFNINHEGYRKQKGAPHFPLMKAPSFEAAFNLTAVQGLNLDLGLKYFLPIREEDDKEWDATKQEWYNLDMKGATYTAPMQVSLGVSFDVTNELTINGRVDAKFAGSYSPAPDAPAGAEGITFGPQINFHLWPAYDLGFATVGLDFGFIWWKEDEGDKNLLIARSDGMRVGAGLFIEKKWGASKVQGGLAYSAVTKTEVSNVGNDIKSTGAFTIPVTFTFVF